MPYQQIDVQFSELLEILTRADVTHSENSMSKLYDPSKYGRYIKFYERRVKPYTQAEFSKKTLNGIILEFLTVLFVRIKEEKIKSNPNYTDSANKNLMVSANTIKDSIKQLHTQFLSKTLL